MSAPPPSPLHLVAPRLVPVVELEPVMFATVERPMPEGSGRALPREWLTYWRASIGDRGLSLDPLPLPGSWSVPLEAFRDPDAILTVATLAARLEADGDRPVALDEVYMFPGGYALADGDTYVWHVACCTGPNDLATWTALFTTPPRTEFVGHAWVSSRLVDGVLELGIREEMASEESLVLRLAPGALPDVLSEAARVVGRFRERLHAALRGHVRETERRAIAERLTRLA